MAEVADENEVVDFAKETRVVVLNTKTNRDVTFKVSWATTLQAVWDASYGKFNPAEHKDADDKFQCQHAGADLTPYLGLTLRQAQEQHICPARKYQIVGGTGGA